jgi:demethylmenaquinone methyltransferase/2-methoxy-6-polyprenyl-1,4-benzoquinol methylase
MTGDRSRAARIYDWWSRHPRLFWVLSQLLFAGRERELRAEAITRLDLAAGERVLDLACGTGVALGDIADAVGGSGSVVGVDLSRGMVRAARERTAGADRIDVVRGDASALPIRPGGVDAVHASLSLSAMPGVERAIEEAYRVLRPEGRFVVLDAQPAQSGPLRLLNPLLNRVSAWATNWYPERDVPATIDAVFDAVTAEYFLGGSFYLIVARKTNEGGGSNGGPDRTDRASGGATGRGGASRRRRTSRSP